MTIKARLILTITLFVALALALIGFATVAITRAQMIDRVDDTLAAVKAKPSRYGIHTSPGPGLDETNPAKPSIATLLFDPSGNLIDANPSGFRDDPDPLPMLEELGPDGLAERSGEIFTIGSQGDSGLRYRALISETEDGRWVAVAAPLGDVDSTINNLVVVIVATSLGILGLLTLVVWFTVRRALRPIDSMIATAGMIGRGDLSKRVDYADANTEVGQLGASLNAMLAQIETSFAVKEESERRLRQFVGDASHELRTPLTSIRGYAELYRTGALSSPQALERAMGRIESEGARMGKLVEDLLLLARLDQGRPLKREPVDLATLVDDAAADARAVEPGRPIVFQRPEAAWVLGDPDRLRQVIDNLLANVRVHTGGEVPVQIEVTADDAGILLQVIDTGPGIEPDDVERVFDRFYRADSSRSRVRGGAGLGLSIVASIVEAHDGEVRIDSSAEQGTTVIVRFPRAVTPQFAEPRMATPVADG